MLLPEKQISTALAVPCQGPPKPTPPTLRAQKIMRFNMAIVNSGSVLTYPDAPGPKRGREMRVVHPIRTGVVGINAGRIAWIGSAREYRKTHRATREIDAHGGLILPGFVDCHTHAVFAGTRVCEWRERLIGASYLEILRQGGGILETVRQTRSASAAQLLRVSSGYLQKMLRHGTTTVEIKSGYGLSLETEMKLLRVIRRLQREMPLDIVSTFLGAHAVPAEYFGRAAEYVDVVLAMLPKVKTLSRFCDVFCEEGAFSVEQSDRILGRASELGFGLKLHAGEFHDLGGTDLVLRYRAVSVDHLDVITKESMRALARGSSVGVLLPGVPHFLSLDRYAPARELIDEGIPIALATDFNPGSSPCLSLQEIMALGVLKMRMTPEEALVGVTINAAAAIGMEHIVGSLTIGKQADLVCLDLADLQLVPYFFGTNHARWVMKRGKLLTACA